MSKFLLDANIHLLKSNKTSIDCEILNLKRKILEKEKEIVILKQRLLTLKLSQERISTNIKDCIDYKNMKKMYKVNYYSCERKYPSLEDFLPDGIYYNEKLNFNNKYDLPTKIKTYVFGYSF